MGRDKASLPFGDETLLERVVRIVSTVADEIWVVAREGQAVADGLRVVRDPSEGLGPLVALAAGLGALESPRAFVTACDTPLLRPELVNGMLALAECHECAVPRLDGHWMPLTAVYSRTLAARARELADAGERRARALAAHSHTRELQPEDLMPFDPSLESLMDCNSPEAYEALLTRAGLRPPATTAVP
jgi:molybdenum cofactor guanylyltransferase